MPLNVLDLGQTWGYVQSQSASSRNPSGWGYGLPLNPCVINTALIKQGGAVAQTQSHIQGPSAPAPAVSVRVTTNRQAGSSSATITSTNRGNGGGNTSTSQSPSIQTNIVSNGFGNTGPGMGGWGSAYGNHP